MCRMQAKRLRKEQQKRERAAARQSREREQDVGHKTKSAPLSPGMRDNPERLEREHVQEVRWVVVVVVVGGGGVGDSERAR